MKNKKGFTLVELLAVIVNIGGTSIVSGTKRTKMMDGAKSNAFKIEAENIAKAAKAAYADDLLNNDSTRSTANGYCYSISYLKTSGFIDKTFSGDHTGSVLVGSSSTSIWYTDGDRSVTDQTSGDISLDSNLNTETTDFDTCPTVTAE